MRAKNPTIWGRWWWCFMSLSGVDLALMGGVKWCNFAKHPRKKRAFFGVGCVPDS